MEEEEEEVDVEEEEEEEVEEEEEEEKGPLQDCTCSTHAVESLLPRQGSSAALSASWGEGHRRVRSWKNDK